MADKVDVLAVRELVAAAESAILTLSQPGAPTRTERDEIISQLRAALATLGGSR